MTVHDVGKLLAADPQALCPLRDVQPQGCQTVVPHRKARMRWVLHRHRLFSLVIIDQIDIAGVTTLEPEDHAPVAGHGDRPETSEIALEAMQPEAG